MVTDDVKSMFREYWAVRSVRLEQEKIAAELKERETELKHKIINDLADEEGFVDEGHVIRRVSKERPYIKDYEELSKFVIDSGHVEVFNRGLNPKAIAELGPENVPGVGYHTTVDLSRRKV